MLTLFPAGGQYQCERCGGDEVGGARVGRRQRNIVHRINRHLCVKYWPRREVMK